MWMWFFTTPIGIVLELICLLNVNFPGQGITMGYAEPRDAKVGRNLREKDKDLQSMRRTESMYVIGNRTGTDKIYQHRYDI
jgi:hypothetical protein